MNNNKSKSKIIVFTILIGISLLLGIAYAFFNYTRTGPANQLVVGEVYLNYTNDNNALSLTNVIPRNSYDANNYIEFTISGLNEHKSKDLWYAIDILHGDIPTGKTEQNRIRDDLLRFRLTKEINNNEEEVLLDNKGYADLDELRMFVETIPKETDDEISHTYRLYMWISDEINVGNTNQSDYTIAEWNNLFASIKVRVVGDFIEKERTDYIKVNFNANGGKVSPVYRYYEAGDTYGTLPVPVRDGYIFEGWATPSGTVVTSLDEVPIDSDFVSETKTNDMYRYIGNREFSGVSDDYIDTGIKLFSSANWQRNFYMEFTIVSDDSPGKAFTSNNDSVEPTGRSTIMSAKNEATAPYAGIDFRNHENTNSYYGKASVNNKNVSGGAVEIFPPFTTEHVVIVRIGTDIRYKLDNGALTQWKDFAGFNNSYKHEVPVTFGAGLTGANGTPRRYFKGTLSNLLVEFIDSNADFTNYENYIHNTFENDNSGYVDVNLKAKWSICTMNTFPEFITNNKGNIKEIYFKRANPTDLARYEAASNSLKGDIKASGTDNSVKAWLEYDNSDQLYTLYIESEGKTFLTTGQELFKDFSSVTKIDFSNVDTSMVGSMSEMFRACTSLKGLDLSNFNTSKVTTMSFMFRYCTSIEYLNISSFDTRQVRQMSSMFDGLYAIESLNLSNFDTGNVINMISMFNGCRSLESIDLSGFNTNNVENMYSMFEGCSGLKSLDLSNFNTSQVTTMGNAFKDCSGLTSITFGSNFVTNKVINMNGIFQGCAGLTSLNLSNFNTSIVEDMSHMFSGCSSLTSITFGSNFTTGSVSNMASMFNGCSGLTSLDLSNFNMSSVANMDSMFESCNGLTSITFSSSYTTSSLTNMTDMFRNCSSLTSLDLSSFNTSLVTNMKDTFFRCSSLQTIYVSNLWALGNGVTGSGTFDRCTSLSGKSAHQTYNYDSSKMDASMAVIATDSQEGYLTDVALKPSV